MVRLYGPPPSRIQFGWGLRFLPGLLAWALVFPGLADAAEFDGSARFSTAAGFDSNATRAFDGQTPDGVGSLQITGRGALRGDGWLLDGTYDGGVRKFLGWPDEDTLVQQASAQGAFRIANPLAAGLDASAKDRRGAERGYTDVSIRAFTTFSPEPRVEVRLSGGARQFWYHPLPLAYSFFATEGGLSARYRLDRHHAFTLFGDLGTRSFEIAAKPPEGQSSPGPRKDLLLGAGLGYAYRGPFTASVGYAFLDIGSNSYGQRLTRHRFSATFGTRLPWELVFLGQGSLQLTAYPEGVPLSVNEQLEDDDESHNSLSLKLLRPLTDRLDVELRYALYQNAFPDTGRRYFRQVGWLGLTFRL